MKLIIGPGGRQSVLHESAAGFASRCRTCACAHVLRIGGCEIGFILRARLPQSREVRLAVRCPRCGGRQIGLAIGSPRHTQPSDASTTARSPPMARSGQPLRRAQPPKCASDEPSCRASDLDVDWRRCSRNGSVRACAGIQGPRSASTSEAEYAQGLTRSQSAVFDLVNDPPGTPTGRKVPASWLDLRRPAAGLRHEAYGACAARLREHAFDVDCTLVE